MLTIWGIDKALNRFDPEGLREARASHFVTLKKIKRVKGDTRRYNIGYHGKEAGKYAGTAYAACYTTSNGKSLDRKFRPIRVPKATYMTMITFIDDSLHVHVQCSCPDFQYRFDWALYRKKASDLLYSTDEPPDVTNPKKIPAICKHILRLYTEIKPELLKALIK